MAVTALRICLVWLSICILHAQGDQNVHRQISYVATALTSGNATDAMTPFDKDFAGYEKLSDYFSALASAYQLTNEIEITSEDDAETTAKVKVHWTLTMTDQQDSFSDSRAADLTFTLAMKEGKWKITDLKPIEFFSPQQRKVGKR